MPDDSSPPQPAGTPNPTRRKRSQGGRSPRRAGSDNPGRQQPRAVSGRSVPRQQLTELPADWLGEQQAEPGWPAVPIEVVGLDLGHDRVHVISRPVSALPDRDGPTGEIVATVIDLQTGYGGTLVELEFDDRTRRVVGHAELSHDGRYQGAGDSLVVGEQLRVEQLEGGVWSQRVSIGVRIQGLPQRGGRYAATVVSTTSTSAALVLEEDPVPDGCVPIIVSVPVSRVPEGTRPPGSRVTVQLRAVSASVSLPSKNLPGGAQVDGLKEIGVKWDKNTSSLRSEKPIGLKQRADLLSLSTERVWALAVTQLWLAALPREPYGLERLLTPSEVAVQQRLAEQLVTKNRLLEGTVKKVLATGAFVTLTDPQAASLPDVFVDRSLIGTGVLEPGKALKCGENVLVQLLQLFKGRLAGELPQVQVEPLIEQFRAAHRDQPVRANRGNVEGGKIQLRLPSLLSRKVPCSSVPSDKDAPIEVTISDICVERFFADNGRLVVVLKPNLSVLSAPTVTEGEHKGTVASVNEKRVIIEVCGVQFSVPGWRIGTIGELLPNRILRPDETIRAEVFLDDRKRHQAKVLLDTCRDAEVQVNDLLGPVGTELRGTVRLATGKKGQALAFVRLDDERRLDGFLPATHVGGIAHGAEVTVTRGIASVTRNRIQLTVALAE